MRFVLVHYHILKNAGTTIESVLQREFGAAFATVHGPSAGSLLDETDLKEFLEARPEVTAISSHHLRYPKPVVREAVIFDCCFLRHPLDRLLSLYTWSRTCDTPDPICQLARNCDPQDFARRLLNDYPHMASNVQVTLLANQGAFLRPANERDLDTATNILHEMAVPGLTELFNQSLVAAEYFLRPAFPEVRLDCSPRNVSRPGPRHRPDREQQLENTLIELWGESVYSDLQRLNEFDLELYRRARREIERRLRLIPRLTQRMADFEARCKARTERDAAEMPVFAAPEIRREISAAHR